MLYFYRRYLYFWIIVILLIIIIFTFFLYKNEKIKKETEIKSNYDFVWPINKYTKISSYFGRRNTIVRGSSSFHFGIDIPAEEGTELYAVDDGIVEFIGWALAGGYTIILKTEVEDLKIIYCHISPILIMKKGEKVKKGDIIGFVGPKNIYNIKNNPYKDKNGIPTNGATTGCHLHFGIKKNKEYIDPLEYYNY